MLSIFFLSLLKVFTASHGGKSNLYLIAFLFSVSSSPSSIIIILGKDRSPCLYFPALGLQIPDISSCFWIVLEFGIQVLLLFPSLAFSPDPNFSI